MDLSWRIRTATFQTEFEILNASRVERLNTGTFEAASEIYHGKSEESILNDYKTLNTQFVETCADDLLKSSFIGIVSSNSATEQLLRSGFSN